jgi:putative RecB family exonuclease
VPLEPPRTLSPSKVSSFTDCPLAFRFSVIEHLPERPSIHAVRGTLVHAALERLFWHHQPGDRSPAAAGLELEVAWAQLQDDDEFIGLALDDDGQAGLLADATALVANYFKLEDPNAVRAVGVELGVEARVGDIRLRGIIDRLDIDDDGELIVIDYKTGRAPSERFERARMAGVHVYALLCEQVLGRMPKEVRLLHLANPMTITAIPSAQTVRGQRQRTAAVWDAINRSCAREDFRPRPGPLCQFCSFQDRCPAFVERDGPVARAS